MRGTEPTRAESTMVAVSDVEPRHTCRPRDNEATVRLRPADERRLAKGAVDARIRRIPVHLCDNRMPHRLHCFKASSSVLQEPESMTSCRSDFQQTCG